MKMNSMFYMLSKSFQRIPFFVFFVVSVIASAQSYTFDVCNPQTGHNYRVTVNTSSRSINVNHGNNRLFMRSFVRAVVYDNGIAFAFKRGQRPSLESSQSDWFFCIKPTAIGFYNKDTETFGMAKPNNPSSYTNTYSSLAAAINTGDALSHINLEQTLIGDDWKNKMTSLFDQLINDNNDELERLDLKDQIEQLFSANAQVRMLGQDTNTMVDRELATVFLERLATSSLLSKVAVVDGELDTNRKILSLKVREIYKK